MCVLSRVLPNLVDEDIACLSLFMVFCYRFSCFVVGEFHVLVISLLCCKLLVCVRFLVLGVDC